MASSRSSRVQPSQPRSRIRSLSHYRPRVGLDGQGVQQVERQVVARHLAEVGLTGGVGLLDQSRP